MIPGRYEQNLAALEALLHFAREDGVAVLVYVVPLRRDVDSPYVQEEYERFKQDLPGRVIEGGAIFADLEVLVPGELWGSKDATSVGGAPELDFMHFRAAGHGLLAGALSDLLEQEVLPK